MTNESWYRPMADKAKKHGEGIDWVNMKWVSQRLQQIMGRIRDGESTPDDWLYLKTYHRDTLYPQMIKYVCLRNAGIE